MTNTHRFSLSFVVLISLTTLMAVNSTEAVAQTTPPREKSKISIAEQSVAHGAAGRAGSELNVIRRGPVNSGDSSP